MSFDLHNGFVGGPAHPKHDGGTGHILASDLSNFRLAPPRSSKSDDGSQSRINEVNTCNFVICRLEPLSHLERDWLKVWLQHLAIAAREAAQTRLLEIELTRSAVIAAALRKGCSVPRAQATMFPHDDDEDRFVQLRTKAAERMRYFIHILTDKERLIDPDGSEFADLAAARAEASQSARDLMAEELRCGRPVPFTWQAQVADDEGNVLLTLPFARLVFSELIAAQLSRISCPTSPPSSGKP
jgi:hypothetical protein